MASFMRSIVLIVLLMLGSVINCDAQEFLPMSMLYRVKKIAVGSAVATAFIIEVESRQYVVTAKHVVAGIKGDSGLIELFGDHGKRVPVSVKVLRCKDPVDIAVLVPSAPLLSVNDPTLTAASGVVTFSQDVFFIGFPYGDDQLSTHFEETAFGFIRKATLSAMKKGDEWFLMFLDGRNNAGFSGGPVVYRSLSEQGHPLRIIGVVSGFRPDFSEVKRLQAVKESDVTDEDRAANRIVTLGNGELRRLVATGDVVMDNTGIVHAYGLSSALDLIKASGSPGPEVKTAQ